MVSKLQLERMEKTKELMMYQRKFSTLKKITRKEVEYKSEITEDIVIEIQVDKPAS